MPSAYYVPTPEASLTAVAARALQGCDDGHSLGWYVSGAQSPSLLSGLGVGAGSGRFNRAVARGVYRLPFAADPTRGSYGLGMDVNPADLHTLLMIVGGASLLWWIFKGGRAARGVVRRERHRHRRMRRMMERY